MSPDSEWVRTLLGESTPSQQHSFPSEEISLDKIDVDASWNSRSGDLNVSDIAESMKSIGLMQPIVVSKQKDRYKLVAGFRRTLAAKKLGWRTIDAKIVPLVDDASSARIYNLAENLSRRNLRLYDTMRTVSDLSERQGIQTARIARDTGMKESRAAAMIRVWPKLSPSLKEKWSRIPDPSWEPTMHQLSSWSALSYPEQNRAWSEWSNDECNPGTDFDVEGEDAYPKPHRGGRQKRRKSATLRAMVDALHEDKTATSRAQMRALLWALGERNTL